MDFFKELMRIAETASPDDAVMLRVAAIKLMPKAAPTTQRLLEIPGFGYLIEEIYAPND